MNNNSPSFFLRVNEPNWRHRDSAFSPWRRRGFPNQTPLIAEWVIMRAGYHDLSSPNKIKMFEKHVQYRWHVFGTLRAFARRDNFFVSDASTRRRTSTRWRSKPVDGSWSASFRTICHTLFTRSCKSHAAYCSIKKSYLGRIGRSCRRDRYKLMWI